MSHPNRTSQSLFELPVAVTMPVYNEALSIRQTIDELAQMIFSRYAEWKLFVFEDGSTDGTKQVLAELASRHKWVDVSSSARRKGYPAASRDAILSIDPTLFPYLVFLDSDGQYDPRDVDCLVEAFRPASLDIVIGKRRVRREALYRAILSRGLYWLEHFMFDTPCLDVTSAFRLMRTEVAQSIARQVNHSRFNFWLEFTARMSLEGSRVAEVPVSYRPRMGESKVYQLRRMPHVVVQEFVSLLETWTEARRV